MADMQSPQHPLEVLPAMLNLVLLQTAKILRDPECHNPKQARLTRMRITKIVTVANQRFHDALDEIEVEILHAKAVMERDLGLVRQKRVERDCANGIGLEPSPPKPVAETVPADTEAIDEKMLLDDADHKADDLQISAVSPTESAAKQSTDPAPGQSTNSAPQEVDDTGEKELEAAAPVAISTGQGMPQDSADSMGLAITLPPEADPDPQAQSSVPDTKPAETSALVPPQQTPAAVTEVPFDMSEAVDMDFSSMINDTDMGGADDALDFDFGLSTHSAMNQNILNNSAFENSNLSNANNADLTNVPLDTNEGVEGVLPGLENYLNADADFSTMNIPTAPTAPTLPQTSDALATAPEQTAATTGIPAQDSGALPAAETSFDDFFGDFDMGGTDDLGDGTLGDLDDFDWS